MSTPSLYRRHRPRTFADVVGQEHVVRTLRNAIEQGKVHHAYLFVGSRGTGKTSMAKILAASLNCERGPTVEPCGVCDSCRAIASATSLDVIEMDAASNNSVDDIRDLREKVAYAPVSGRHKVYILDEAHMLSTAAWNAFLKTLEEPPPNTIFVLATTEAAKVPPTVVDRCHRFDFSRPTVPQIVSVLRRAADAESIEIPDEALALVARSATGSFRDALGTLEQLLAYSGTTIALDDVLAVLGAADSELLLSVVDAVASGDAREALLVAARLADSGRDVGRFFTDLETHARGLMVVQTLGGGVPAELSITPERDERLAEQAARVPPGDVVRLLDLIAVALRAMKDGSDARTQLELTLVKAAVPEHDAGTTALLSRIERLEARLAGAAPARAESGPPARAEPAKPTPTAPATPTGPRQPERSASAEPAPKEPAPAERSASAEPAPKEPAPAERTASAETPPSEPAPPQPNVSAETPQPASPEPAPAQPTVAAEAPQPEAAVAVADAGPLDLPRFAAIWPAVLESLEGEYPKLAACLGHARPAALTAEELTLAWGASSAFLKRIAEDPANREAIVSAIRAVTGTGLRLTHELRDDEEAVADPGERPLSEEELIARFMAEFDAEELPPDDPQTSEA